MVSRYRSVLGAEGVRQLLLSSVLARMPLGICSLAILLFVRGQTGSFLLAGLAVGAFTLGSAAVAPVQGALVDRLGQVPVLAPCAAGQGALLILLVVLGGGAPAAVIVLVAALAGALTPPVSACLRVLWPEVVVDPADREAAYALDAISQEIIWVLGPLLVAVVIEFASPAVAVLVGAAVTMFGTALFASTPLARRWRGRSREPREHRGALSSSQLRSLFACALAVGTMIGAVEVGLPALAGELGSHGLAGVLLALWSVGSMAGGVLYSARSWRQAVSVRHVRLLACGAVLTAPLLLVNSLAWGIVSSVLAGLATAPVFSCQYTLISTLAPAGAIAEAFTWQTAALVGGIAAGSALGGALIDLGGAHLAFLLACAAATVAFMLAVLEGPGADRIGALAS